MSAVQNDDDVRWPPGLIGKLALAIFSVSQRPVKEISIAAAFALVAGMCGRAFHVNGSGLNLYWILVARSAIGKEAIGDGITAVLNLLDDIPGAKNFVDMTEFASGPALHKAILTRPSFLQVGGEFGKTLKRMSGTYESPQQTLRTTMTKAYSKSGPGQWMDGIQYSNSEKSMPPVNGHAYSFIGESTPGSFSAALTPDMMEDGFISRFNIMSYQGERPAANLDMTMEIEPEDLQAFRTLAAIATPHNQPFGRPPRIQVMFRDRSAAERLCPQGTFDEECDAEINRTDDESQRQMWNRAHLKALRMSAVMAAADNPVHPTIDLGHAVYAITSVKRDIAVMKMMMGAGEVGNDDTARIELVKAALRDYFFKPVPLSYDIPAGMRDGHIVTYKYIQLRVIKKPAFQSNLPKGSLKLLEETLKSLEDSGALMLVDKKTCMDQFLFSGKAYRLTGELR